MSLWLRSVAGRFDSCINAPPLKDGSSRILRNGIVTDGVTDTGDKEPCHTAGMVVGFTHGDGISTVVVDISGALRTSRCPNRIHT